MDIGCGKTIDGGKCDRERYVDGTRNGTREKDVSVLLQQWQTKTMLVCICAAQTFILWKSLHAFEDTRVEACHPISFWYTAARNRHTRLIWLNEIVGSSKNNVFVCLKISA